MSHIGEGRWQQYVLDECDAETTLTVEAHLALCSLCRKRLAQERRLDQWLLESVPTAPVGSAERSLQRLWETLDETAAGPHSAPHRARLRPGVFCWPALAAASLLVSLWMFSEPPGEQGIGSEPVRDLGSASDSAVPLPSVSRTAGMVLADPVDPERLASARRLTATILLSAQASHAGRDPQQEELFVKSCDEELASLRRQGWPVGSLIRGFALGDDDQIADAALRYAAREPSAGTVLAAALNGREQRVVAVLRELDHEPGAIESSISLVRALERRAARNDADGRCALLLSRAGGPRSRRALERLLEVRKDQALADPGSVPAGESLLRVLPLVPTAWAVEALLEVAEEPSREPAMKAAFLDRLGSDRLGCLEALEAQLALREPPSSLLPWVVAGQVSALSGPLLGALEDEPGNHPLLNTLVALGGGLAAQGLTSLWFAESGSRQRQLLAGLTTLLGRDHAAVRSLGAFLARRDSDEALQLADALPGKLASPLLVSCLSARADDAAGEGDQAALLVALARRGQPAEGPALMDWIVSRPADEPLLALAWAAVAQVDPTLAGSAWAALGHDPVHLNQVALSTARRFSTSSIPSRRLLTPLRRALLASAH